MHPHKRSGDVLMGGGVDGIVPVDAHDGPALGHA